MDLKEYYSNLLIVQYNGKQKAKATIEALVEDDDLLSEIRDAFDIETAIGKQLDILGKYIGISRQYNGGNLSDDDYRIILKLKIIRNSSNHSYLSIVNSLYAFFPDEISVATNYDMTNTFFVVPDLSTIVTVAFELDVLPIPMGVGVTILTREFPFFAFATYDFPNVMGNVQGFSDYTNFETLDGYFLEYDNFN